MARNSRQVFIPNHQNKTAGGGTDQDYTVIRQKDYSTALNEFGFFHTPTPILAVVQVEGVDFPMQPHRFVNQDEALRKAQALRVQALNYSRLSTLEGLGAAYANIYSDPPIPDVYVEYFAFPFDGLARFRRLKFWETGYATSSAPGSWINAIPATTYRVPICEVLDEIQFHLLETADFGGSIGSGLWTLTEIMQYVNQRTSRFLLETGIIQTRTTQAQAAAEIADLPTDLIDIRRIAWTRGGTTTELPRQDLEEVDSWIPAWETSGAADPIVYSQAPEPSLQIRLAQVPSNAGTLDIIYIANAETMAANCNIFSLPDEWVPFIKYGVLADMLGKEGEANDPDRAAYCEQRWKEGIELARLLLG